MSINNADTTAATVRTSVPNEVKSEWDIGLPRIFSTTMKKENAKERVLVYLQS